MSNLDDSWLKKCTLGIANNLKQLLARQAISILELAKESKISYSATYRLVHGESNPNLDTLLRIAKVFNVTVSQIIGDLPILSYNYSIQSIPIIDWQDITNFLNNTESYKLKTTNNFLLSSQNIISNKCFALYSNVKTNHLFCTETILIFDTLNKKLEEYDSKFILVSDTNEIPVMKKLCIEGSKIFLQSVNPTIPACELLNPHTVQAYLVQARTDF